MRLRTPLSLAAAVWMAASVALLSVASPARAYGQVAAPLGLVSQSTWVAAGGTFSLRLDLGTDAGPGYQLRLSAYPRLAARSSFDQAAVGNMGGSSPVWSDQVPVSGLHQAGGGVVDVQVPVDRSPPPGGLATFWTGPASGVYPLQVQLVDAGGVPVGAAMSTFIVFSAGTSGFAKLSVAVSLPLSASTAVDSRTGAAAVGTGSTTRLSALARVVEEYHHVPLSLEAGPETMQALASGSASQRRLVSRIAGLVRGGDQLLPEPYVPVNLGGLLAGAGAGPFGLQLQAGASALRAALGVAATASTWVFGGRLDAVTARALVAGGVTRLVLPASDLSSLPSTFQNTTYARPAVLGGVGAPRPEVYAADPVLSSRLLAIRNPVLAAQQLLAELAMIQLETPSVRRGVAIVAPATASVSPELLATLLSGLSGNPFVEPVTVGGLFGNVGLDPSSPGGGPTLRLRLGSAPAGVPGGAALARATSGLTTLGQVLAGGDRLLGPLQEKLLLAPSPDLAGSTRRRLVATAESGVDRLLSQITLPSSGSVTLTSSAASVPVTVDSIPGQTVHLDVTFSSPRLGFLPQRGARCSTSPTSMTCALVLTGAVTTLRIPVEARTSGVFPLQVTLAAPGGAVIAQARDTVRSTAVSFVGLALMVCAGAFLGIWWARNIRHGHRARRLVRRPGDDAGGDEGGQGDPGHGDPGHGDPVHCDPGGWPGPRGPGEVAPVPGADQGGPIDLDRVVGGVRRAQAEMSRSGSPAGPKW